MWPLVLLIGLSQCAAQGHGTLGTLSLPSGFSWSFHALMWVGQGPVVCLGRVSSFRTFSKFAFLINQAPHMIKIFKLKIGF